MLYIFISINNSGYLYTLQDGTNLSRSDKSSETIASNFSGDREGEFISSNDFLILSKFTCSDNLKIHLIIKIDAF